MKVALAISDLAMERAILHHLADSGGEVVRRCLTPAEADRVPEDVDLLVDAGFERRHGSRIRRRYRLVDGIPQIEARASSPRGRVISIAASIGGSGATTTALYAAALAESSRILVIDADMWHPTVGLYVVAGSSLRGVHEAMQMGLTESIAAWTAGVWVLGGIDAPSRRHQITSEGWQALLEQARTEFDEVRVDLGSHLADDHPVVSMTLAASDACVLVTSAHPRAALHGAAADALARHHCGRVLHVLNQTGTGPVSSTAQRMLSTSIGRSIDVCIPSAPESYERAFIEGVPLPDGRRAPAQQAIRKLNSMLQPTMHRRTGSRSR